MFFHSSALNPRQNASCYKYIPEVMSCAPVISNISNQSNVGLLSLKRAAASRLQCLNAACFMQAPSMLRSRHHDGSPMPIPSLSLSRPCNTIIIPFQKHNTQPQTPQRPTQIQLNDRPYPKHAQWRSLLQDRVIGIHIRDLDEVAACCH